VRVSRQQQKQKQQHNNNNNNRQHPAEAKIRIFIKETEMCKPEKIISVYFFLLS
jgi:hypothetical protein